MREEIEQMSAEISEEHEYKQQKKKLKKIIKILLVTIIALHLFFLAFRAYINSRALNITEGTIINESENDNIIRNWRNTVYD